MADYEADAIDYDDSTGGSTNFQFADEPGYGMDELPATGEENPTSGEDVNWQTEAKKFQSMYDTANSKLSELEKIEPLKNLLETRPDLVKKLQEGIVSGDEQGVQASDVGLKEDEFNPWDAYYKPDSPSYKFRQDREQRTVQETLQGHMAALEQEQAIKNTVTELRNSYRMHDDEIRDFMDWSLQPKEAVGLGNLVSVFRGSQGKTQEVPNSVEAVRQTQRGPASAGASHGLSPQAKSSEASAWDGIIKSGSRNSVL
jgi:hypothetical protein